MAVPTFLSSDPSISSSIEFNIKALIAGVIFFIDCILMGLLIFFHKKAQTPKCSPVLSYCGGKHMLPVIHSFSGTTSTKEQLKKYLWVSNDLLKFKMNSNLRKAFANKSRIELIIQNQNHAKHFKRIYKSLCVCKQLKALQLDFFSDEMDFSKHQTKLFEKSLVNLKHIRHFHFRTNVNTLLANTIQKMKDLTTLKLDLQNLDLTDESIKMLGQKISRFRKLNNLQIYFAGLQNDINAPRMGFLGHNILKIKQLTKLQLSFANCLWLTDQRLISLCQGLFQMKQLTHLELDLAYCIQLTDRSLCWLGERLPRLTNLMKLQLYLLDVVGITHYGTSMLWSGIAQLTKLTYLQIDFYKCFNIESKALISISDGVSKLGNLTELHLYFGMCFKLDTLSVNSLGSALSKLKRLSQLELEFINCPMTNANIASLAQALNCLQLDSLKLSLNGCEGITDEGFIHLSKSLSSLISLNHLSLKLLCSQITMSGFITLTQNIAKIQALETLDLELTDFHQMVELGMASLGEALIRLLNLHKVYLSFTKSRGFTDAILITLGDYISKMKALNDLKLYVESLPISDEGVINFAKSIIKTPFLKKIKIDVFKCFVSIRGKAALKACKNYIHGKKQ